jgi:hypothetical protein
LLFVILVTRVKLVAGFDDTIAVIQYLLLKAQIPHIYSEYYFMDVFLEETTNDGTEPFAQTHGTTCLHSPGDIVTAQSWRCASCWGSWVGSFR